MTPSDLPDWTTDEYLANLAAEELSAALDRHRIMFHNVAGDEDGTVSVAFVDLRDAEAMMTLAIEQAGPGTVYDRATGSCVSLTALAATGGEVPDEQVAACITAGWNWMVHPHMRGRRMGWHVSVDIPTADANAMTAALNTQAHGGAV
jgi:hypothetical protein